MPTGGTQPEGVAERPLPIPERPHQGLGVEEQAEHSCSATTGALECIDEPQRGVVEVIGDPDLTFKRSKLAPGSLRVGVEQQSSWRSTGPCRDASDRVGGEMPSGCSRSGSSAAED